jgi:hypothetical protein
MLNMVGRMKALNKRLVRLHERLVDLNTQFNGFLSGNYEIRFLQDSRLTVCVIRNLYKLDERYTGVSVLHPHDKFDAAVGRHKAFKAALANGYKSLGSFYSVQIFSVRRIPVSQLQKDYWKRYGAEEK